MKSEVSHVGGSRRDVRVEVPAEEVERTVERVARRYARAARIPGFRPGKAPQAVVRQRFREEIRDDVAKALVPGAVDAALEEHALAPVASPEIRDLEMPEGRPLTFTAAIEILPPVDPGSYDAFVLRRQPPPAVDEAAVDREIEQLRIRAARSEPVEGRPADTGDTVTLDLERRLRRADGAESEPERHVNVTLDIGNPDNPPGFDDQLRGVEVGATREFTLPMRPEDGAADESATEARYAIEVRGVHRRHLPALDDEFARDVGAFDDLAALRARVRSELEEQGLADAAQGVRDDLLQQLAARLTGDVPEALVASEVERRVARLARHLIGQRIDLKRVKVDWNALREAQREPAALFVRSALVLDEIARRESIEIGDEELDQEIERQAAATGQRVAAVRAALQKDGDGRPALAAGLRREKAIDFLLARATIVSV